MQGTKGELYTTRIHCTNHRNLLDTHI